MRVEGRELSEGGLSIYFRLTLSRTANRQKFGVSSVREER